MHETALFLPVVLPEAVLTLGTLLLVLYGALRGERAYDAEAEALVVHCDGWTFVTGAPPSGTLSTFNAISGLAARVLRDEAFRMWQAAIRDVGLSADPLFGARGGCLFS